MSMLPAGTVAPLQRRTIAYVIDVLIANAIALVAGLIAFGLWAVTGRGLLALTIGGPLVLVVAVAWALVYTAMQGGAGSIGMRAQGLKLVSASTGAPLGFGKALLRNIIWVLAASIIVGYFSVLFDSSGRFQGWHDKVADALMLDGRAPLAESAPATSAMVLPAPPSGSAVAPSPEPAAPAPAHAASPVTHSAPAPDPVDETVVAPRSDAAAHDDPLISFVPGVTQPPLARPEVAPAPAAPSPVAPSPAAPSPAAPSPAAPHPVASPSSPPAVSPAAAGPAEPQAAAPVAVVASDDDPESTRISIPGHRLVFTWDDGQRVTVSARTVFGRNPEQEAGAVIVAVRDETRSLSKTHFEAGAAPTGGWVMDRHSTNGTLVVRDGARIACPPGQRMPVRLGDALEIGDRIVTIGGYA